MRENQSRKCQWAGPVQTFAVKDCGLDERDWLCVGEWGIGEGGDGNVVVYEMANSRKMSFRKMEAAERADILMTECR